MNRKILTPVLALVVLTGISAYGMTTVSAYNNKSEISPMLQRLAERFNLNKDEVNKFVSEERTARQSQMQKKFDEKIAQLVKEGNLTESQKNALINKHKEMQNNNANFNSLTLEEKRAKKQAQREEYEAWAKTEGIDLSLVRPMGKMDKGYGMHNKW